MSTENLATFFSQVGTDPDLAAKLAAMENLSTHEKAAALAKLSEENGSPITAEELLAFFTSTIPDEELSEIAGGARSDSSLTHDEATRRRERFENFFGNVWDKTKECATITSGIGVVGKLLK